MIEDKSQKFIENFMTELKGKNPNEPEFHQAVHEVVETLTPFILENPVFLKNKILARMAEPERIISFRVPWLDDRGEIQINKGYRVQMNSAIGPYKGGLRFHASVNQSILKFLAYEQVLKNSLTTLPMGGAKGGSDFNPKGKSDNEVMKFCQSFATELERHVGPNTDIPAGDIGVGGREIGYIFGQYKRLANAFQGTFTGKGAEWGGNPLRPEATGYGAVYFAQEMLKTKNDSIEGKKVVISGSGNVAQYSVEKVLELGGTPLTVSDSNGYIYDPKGINTEKLDYIKVLKNAMRGRIWEYAEKYPEAQYFEGESPWKVKCDIAIPAATQNELHLEDAQNLLSNGCICISEGANMPCTSEALHFFIKNKILFGPGKAANAGGVAVSGLEMSQNSMRLSWTRDEVDFKLKSIMKNIHEACVRNGQETDGFVNYVKGANISGFIKVANAMIAQGAV
jgi:glutamate dehydrogenase (NADP+)